MFGWLRVQTRTEGRESTVRPRQWAGTLRRWSGALRRRGGALRQWFSNHQHAATVLTAGGLVVAVLSLVNDCRPPDQPPLADVSTTRPSPRVPDAPGSGSGVTAGNSTGSATPTPETWAVRIANTYSEEQRRFRGVVAARSPYARGATERGYLEGTVIHVICQVPDGRQVVDEVAGQKMSTTVWYKTTDAVWIPDIYADLVTPGDDGPPRCRPDDLPRPPSPS